MLAAPFFTPYKGLLNKKNKNKMKRKFKIQVKSDVVQYAWEKYKNELTMAELAKILGLSLPTFFRLLKRKSQQKVVEGQNQI
jgi:DNA-binding transcriptional regulator LsrR (DeoR family)